MPDIVFATAECLTASLSMSGVKPDLHGGIEPNPESEPNPRSGRRLVPVQAATNRSVFSAVRFARACVASRPATSNEPSGLTIAQRQSSSCSRSVSAKLAMRGRQVTSSVASEKRQLAETKAASAAEGMARKEHQVELANDVMNGWDLMSDGSGKLKLERWGVILKCPNPLCLVRMNWSFQSSAPSRSLRINSCADAPLFRNEFAGWSAARASLRETNFGVMKCLAKGSKGAKVRSKVD